MNQQIPEFKSEAEEFEFWSSTGRRADSTEYLDWSRAECAKFPNLKPTLATTPLNKDNVFIRVLNA